MADNNDKVAEARRRFLENCGRFAVRPPTVALMLSAPGSVRAALAASGGTTTKTVGTTPTTPAGGECTGVDSYVFAGRTFVCSDGTYFEVGAK